MTLPLLDWNFIWITFSATCESLRTIFLFNKHSEALADYMILTLFK